MLFHSKRILYLRELSILLDLTAMAMEAGLDFGLALDRVVKFGPQGLMSEQFRQVLRDIALGARRLDALKEMRARTQLRELNGLIQAVSLAESLGGNLAATLRNHAENLRLARFAQAERSAQQIPVKLVFPLVFLIFPCVFLVLFGPICYHLLHNGIL